MKKRILLSLLTVLSTLAVHAQYQITGCVKDERNIPVAYANIALLRPDSAFVCGSISNEKGEFTLADVKQNSYLLKISYIGYITQFVSLKHLNSTFNAGNITLPEKASNWKKLSSTDVLSFKGRSHGSSSYASSKEKHL